MSRNPKQELVKAAKPKANRTEYLREGNLIYLNAASKLACQLLASRRQLDRLERHANRMLRSMGAA